VVGSTFCVLTAKWRIPRKWSTWALLDCGRKSDRQISLEDCGRHVMNYAGRDTCHWWPCQTWSFERCWLGSGVHYSLAKWVRQNPRTERKIRLNYVRTGVSISAVFGMDSGLFDYPDPQAS